jgi:hypothetical protein
MSAKRLHVVVPGIIVPTSRRDFLRYGGGAAGAALLAPFWPRGVVAQSATTFDFYISPTASPSGDAASPGTLASPWSLNALNTRGSTYAGKRVGIIGDQGTYNCLSIYTTANGGSSFGAQGYLAAGFQVTGGTAGSPTFVGSCNSSGVYAVSLAVLDGGVTSISQGSTVNSVGNAIIGNQGVGQSNGSSYVTIDGLTIQNVYYRHIAMGCQGSAGSVNGMVVQNCHLTGTLYNQLGGANPSFITIYNSAAPVVQNNLGDATINDSSNRTSGIEFWACNNHLAQYNTLIMTAAGCAGLYIKNVNQYNAQVRYNYFDLSACPSLASNGVFAWDLQGSSSNTSAFHHNIIVSNGQCNDTNIYDVSNGNYAENRQHYNNTFVGVPGMAAYCLADQGSGAFFTGYNNIFARTSVGGTGDVTLLSGSVATENYNLFQTAPRVSIAGASYSSLAALQAAGYDTHSIVGAPTFVGGSPTLPSQKYQLASGSLGKGTGSSNGQTSGTAIDMGAWGGTDLNTGQAIAQIGANLTSSVTTPTVPMAPVLSVS